MHIRLWCSMLRNNWLVYKFQALAKAWTSRSCTSSFVNFSCRGFHRDSSPHYHVLLDDKHGDWWIKFCKYHELLKYGYRCSNMLVPACFQFDSSTFVLVVVIGNDIQNPWSFIMPAMSPDACVASHANHYLFGFNGAVISIKQHSCNYKSLVVQETALQSTAMENNGGEGVHKFVRSLKQL